MFYYYFESKKLECQDIIKKKLFSQKNQKKKVNVENNKGNVYEKIILQDAEHDNNIN